jgi:hypothetical protein
MMVYVGIDLHRNRSQIVVLDQDGSELLSRRVVNDPQLFLVDQERVKVGLHVQLGIQGGL